MPYEYRPLVRVRDLRFGYRGVGHAVLAIPTLDIAGTGLTALVGASGAGKSTLVELLAGTLREPYEGTIETLGVDIASLRSDGDRQRHLRRIGFIPQDFGLLPGWTIRQIFEQDLADAQIPRQERAGRIASAAEAVGLVDFLDRDSNLLSGGQRQRAAIARMLARDVELVIADEPTANLDAERAREVLGLFRQLAVSRPVILVTHDPWLASECQRTVLLQTAGSTSDTGRVAHPGPRRRWLWAGAAILAAGLTSGGAYAAVRLTSAGKGPTTTATGRGNAPLPSAPEGRTSVPTTAPASGATPWPFVVQPEDCSQLSFGADGTFGPAACSDTRPNLQAVLYAQRTGLAAHSQLLKLGRYASPGQVEAAACQDLTDAGGGGTIPIVTTEAQLAWAENDWIFGGLTPDLLSQYMISGGCNASTATASAVPTPSQAPYSTCQLYVPGKEAYLTIGGNGLTSAVCSKLIQYLHHNQWDVSSNPPSSLPSADVRCNVPSTLLPLGASGVVSDNGTISTATGDNACQDLQQAAAL